MTKQDVLYKQTLVRVGPEKMVGVQRLIDGGHTGIAEKHTVSKLITYIKALEEKLGITVPDPDRGSVDKRFMKITGAAGTYFAPAAA